MKFSAYIWIAVFIAMILVPSIGMFFKPNREEFIRIEKREPFQMPSSFNAELTKNIELSVQDVLLYRHKSLQILSRLYYALRTSLQQPKAIVGQSEWLFLGDAWDFSISKYRDIFGFNKVPLNNVEHVQNLFHLAQLASSTKMLVVAPDKHSAYPEELPSWIVRGKDYNRMQLFGNALTGPDPQLLTFLNLEEHLLSSKINHQNDLYYYKDSHWNYVGGYEGYSKIIETFNNIQSTEIRPENRLGNRLQKLSEINFLMSSREGDMAAFLQLSARDPDPIPTFSHNENLMVKNGETPYVLLPSDAKPEAAHWISHYKNENALNDRSILFLGDSFSEMIVPYFLQTFSRVTSVHYHPIFTNKIPAEELFSEGEFDYVVIVMAQRVI